MHHQLELGAYKLGMVFLSLSIFFMKNSLNTSYSRLAYLIKLVKHFALVHLSNI